MRNKSHIWIVIWFVLFFSVGCWEKEESFRMGQFIPMDAEKTSEDVFVPSLLVEQIEKKYLKHLRGQELHEDLSDTEILLNVPRQLMNVKVFLKGLSSGIIEEDRLVHLPLGGGVLDLANHVSTTSRGSFTFGIDVLLEGKVLEDFDVYFVSHALVRQINKKTFGAGCGTTLNITEHFHRVMAGEGFRANTTEQRYLALLGGTFVFVKITSKALGLAYLTVTDSHHPHLLCALDGEIN